MNVIYICLLAGAFAAAPIHSTAPIHNTVPLHAAPNYNVSAEVFRPRMNVTLADLYGKVKEVTNMDPWAERVHSRIARSDKYFALRQPDSCNFPIELVIIQDVTESFDKHYPVMIHQELPEMIASLSETHPHSSYGLVTCGDKPVWSLGVPDLDYCVKIEVPLTENTQSIYDKYSELTTYGGGDPQENQFGCIQAAAEATAMKWDDAEASRLIVLVTDAHPHFEGDGFQKPEYNMIAFSGHWDEAKSDEQCVKEYYPNPDDVKNALSSRQAYAAFLIFDGNYWGSLPTSSYEWFNGYIGQTPEFVGPLGPDSSSFWTTLAQTIRQMELVECGISSTTEEIAATTTNKTKCPPCPDPCEPCDGPCHSQCGCPEIEIRLAHRPKQLKLEYSN